MARVLGQSMPARPRRQILRPQRELSLGDHVSDLCWTVDAGTAVAATLDGQVQAIALAPATPPRLLGEHPGGALSADVSRDGLVASGGQDGRLRIVRLNDAGVIAERHLGGWVEQVRWAPSGRRLATAAGKRVCFLTADGRPGGEIDGHAGAVTAIWWDAAGRSLTTACPDGLRLLRPNRRRPLVHIPWDSAGAVLGAVESPDERYIAMAHLGGTVSVLQVRTSRSIQYGGFAGKIRKLIWSPDARHLAVAAGNKMAVFGFTPRGPDRTRARVLRGHRARVRALAFITSARAILLASGCEAGRVLMWSQARDLRRTAAVQLDMPIEHLFASADGRRLAVAGRGGRLGLFSVED